MTRNYLSCFLLSVLLATSQLASAIDSKESPNANPAYQQLRALLPTGSAYTVNNLGIRRGAGLFTLSRGSIVFYGEVNGKITGAIFRGQGHLHLAPPNAEERHNLAITTHSEQFDEDFDQAVLRFTDGTAAELRAASAGQTAADGSFADAATQLHTFLRTKLDENVDLRLLADVLSPSPGQYFMAALHGKKDHNLLFTLDPHGAPAVAPEQESLTNWTDGANTILTAFADGDANSATEAYRIDSEDLDTAIEKNGALTGQATLHLAALQDGLAVVPLSLYHTLRVSSVTTATGDKLNFVQGKKDEDADFGVVLAKPLSKGASVEIRIAYGGKDVVMDEGNSNYYPIARHSWYPNSSSDLGNYTTYHMKFHVPKGLQLIATGTKISESTEGKITTSEWKTDVPLAVVGFNLGQFKMKEGTLKSKSGYTLNVDAYANTQPPDEFSDAASHPGATPNGRLDQQFLEQAPTGSINTTSMLAVQLSQGEAAASIYTNYFGQLPFSTVALTQQFACNYGQSWPMLVYLPICGFLDPTQQHAFGLDPSDMYWKTVTPHEVAHQWWGQTVGFRSYRDQWMSEGFADASAALFLLATEHKPDNYLAYWKQNRLLLTQKNAMGFRPIDVGPVTMGFRLSSEKTGWGVYQNLVYPKGAYILHMIRMMMWSQRDGDAQFIAMMKDFVSTYKMKAATTEDFKSIVEKHMTSQMDLEHNHRMDWFFREYVYGTDLPAYHFESDVNTSGGNTSLHFKLIQSGVPQDFINAVPLYLELANGQLLKLGSIAVTGQATVDQTVALPHLPSPVKGAVINHFYDVLCTDN